MGEIETDNRFLKQTLPEARGLTSRLMTTNPPHPWNSHGFRIVSSRSGLGGKADFTS
jgi:hypothetical protein